MDKQQRKYALDRVQEILNEKVHQVKIKNTVTPVVFTAARRIEMIKSGEAVIKQNHVPRGESSNFYLTDLYEFPGERAQLVDTVTINVEVAKLKAQATAITDQLMLGTEEEALRLLKEFSE